MFEQAFKNIDDVLYKDAGCTSELDYTEQTSWLLFLKYLDALDHDKATEAALGGIAEAGFAVRWLPGQGLPHGLRITIGTQEQMADVARILRNLVEQA